MSPLMLFHTIIGTIALLAGAMALFLKKGSLWHRRAGTVFVVTMVALTTTGIYFGIVGEAKPVAILGAYALYLAATSYVTARRKDGEIGWFEPAAFLFLLSICAACVWLGIEAARNPMFVDGYPVAPGAFYMLIGIMAPAVILDINMLVRRGLSGRQRIARHLWRMCYAMFNAAAAIFTSNSEALPEVLQSGLLLSSPLIVIIGMMIFWILRVRFSKIWQNDRRA